jgi:hypothetical protein
MNLEKQTDATKTKKQKTGRTKVNDKKPPEDGTESGEETHLEKNTDSIKMPKSIKEAKEKCETKKKKFKRAVKNFVKSEKEALENGKRKNEDNKKTSTGYKKSKTSKSSQDQPTSINEEEGGKCKIPECTAPASRRYEGLCSVHSRRGKKKANDGRADEIFFQEDDLPAIDPNLKNAVWKEYLKALKDASFFWKNGEGLEGFRWYFPGKKAGPTAVEGRDYVVGEESLIKLARKFYQYEGNTPKFLDAKSSPPSGAVCATSDHPSHQEDPESTTTTVENGNIGIPGNDITNVSQCHGSGTIQIYRDADSDSNNMSVEIPCPRCHKLCPITDISMHASRNNCSPGITIIAESNATKENAPEEQAQNKPADIGETIESVVFPCGGCGQVFNYLDSASKHATDCDIISGVRKTYSCSVS